MPYKKGESGNAKGRPKGSKDKIPRTYRALAAAVVSKEFEAIQRSLLAGIKSKQSHRYHAILASLEKHQVELTGADGGAIQIIHNYSA